MKPAFTLIEMLLALARAAGLMIALLTVSASLARTERVMAEAVTEADGKPIMIELLRRDLLQAHQITPGENEIELSGHGGLDRYTMSASHRPALVRYTLEGDWIVRTQTDVDELTNRNTWSELMIGRVSRFTVERIEEESDDTGNEADDDDKPARVRLTVRWTDDTRAPLREVIFAR